MSTLFLAMLNSKSSLDTHVCTQKNVSSTLLTDILIIDLNLVCSTEGGYWGSWMAWLKHPDCSRARSSFCYIESWRTWRLAGLCCFQLEWLHADFCFEIWFDYIDTVLIFFQIDFMYYVNSDLLVAFQCDHRTSFKYIIIVVVKNQYSPVKYHFAVVDLSDIYFFACCLQVQI